MVYYTDASDRKPVKEFLAALTPLRRAKLIHDLLLLEEFGFHLKEPHVKPLGDGIWELRVQVEGDAYRALYFTWTGHRFVVLHAFQKKTQKTPARELATARHRRADWLARQQETK